MHFAEFPISGPLRFPLLIFEWIFAFIAIELGFIFILKYYAQKEKAKTFQELGFASFFLSFSLMWFFFIIGNYYSSDINQTPFLRWNEGSLDIFI